MRSARTTARRSAVKTSSSRSHRSSRSRYTAVRRHGAHADRSVSADDHMRTAERASAIGIEEVSSVIEIELSGQSADQIDGDQRPEYRPCRRCGRVAVRRRSGSVSVQRRAARRAIGGAVADALSAVRTVISHNVYLSRGFFLEYYKRKRGLYSCANGENWMKSPSGVPQGIKKYHGNKTVSAVSFGAP